MEDDRALVAWIANGSVPVAPTLRNFIRYRDGLGLEAYGPQNFFFGSSRPVCKFCYERRCRHRDGKWERVKTKLHISSAYPLDDQNRQWEIRVWGWLPHDLPQALTLDRKKTLTALRDRLEDKKFWRDTLGNSLHFAGLDWRDFSDCAQNEKVGTKEQALNYLAALLV
jgi:hypothetical protein